jgi:hypothetical protein
VIASQVGALKKVRNGEGAIASIRGRVRSPITTLKSKELASCPREFPITFLLSNFQRYSIRDAGTAWAVAVASEAV